jgi:hypothetical protein
MKKKKNFETKISKINYEKKIRKNKEILKFKNIKII